MLAGDADTLGGVLRRVAAIAGTKGPMTVPDPVIRAAAAAMGLAARVLPMPQTMHPETLRVALASYLGTRAKAERELGWRPRSLEVGLSETVAARQR